MRKKSKNSKNRKNAPYDLMQDTQYLMMGLEDVQSESYALEDILAEFGSENRSDAEKTEEKVVAVPVNQSASIQEELPAQDISQTADLSELQVLHPNVIAFPGVVEEPENNSVDDTMVLIDMREYEEEPSPEELFGLRTEPPEEKRAPRAVAEEPAKKEGPAEPKPLTMEDIVAGTVDAVKAEQEKKLRKQRRRMEKIRKKRRVPTPKLLLPETAEEQPPRDAAVFHKRRWKESGRALALAVPVLLMMWTPYFLEKTGISVPYFSASAENAAVCILVAHSLLCILCWSVFRAALEELKQRHCTCYTYTALTNLVALLDAATFLLLPGRTAPAPLGCVAAAALVFAHWGLKCYHRGMMETFRTAALGEPSCVADRCEAGIARGQCRREGFVLRANMESTASHWQRLLLPVLAAACLALAVLSSAGQGKGQNFLWCWSAMLCASCSLVCPMAYCVPLERVARRLGRSGTAVAGQYGAAVLAGGTKIVVTDTDLFPRNCVSLSGIKLYGEERNRAISYAATLAVQGGGCMGRLFEAVCQSEHISCQHLEHFHIHDDNGLSGMIRGETVLVGTPLFMRHKAVRLPSRLPAKTALCLAVDGELTAVFALKYQTAAPVETAMRALGRNGIQLVLATRDGNITPKRLKQCFGADGKATLPEISDRLSLSDPQREAGAPNGLIYRDGLLPFVEMTALSRRLCQMVKVGNLLSMLGSIFGALLGFYLTYVGRSDALSPVMMMVYLLLWTLPMLPLLLGVDKM